MLQSAKKRGNQVVRLSTGGPDSGAGLFAQTSLNELFDLAMGLWPAAPGEDALDPQGLAGLAGLTGLAERAAAAGSPVVCDRLLDAHPKGCTVGHSRMQEGHGQGFALVGVHFFFVLAMVFQRPAMRCYAAKIFDRIEYLRGEL